ncbi:MAG: hypothetical protein JWN18_473 [Parcubacteria group bacterium]|nr:hypothetical protein [Parcubacteria group bacterium]
MFVIRRESHNPLLTPRHDQPWEGIAAYNPSVVQTKEGSHMFYRAYGEPDALRGLPSISTIGMAFAQDGIHFTVRQQVIAPKEEWDNFGCEDPRVTFFEGKWYCFYTALGDWPFGPSNIKVALAIGDSPSHFTERHLITPFNAKAATLFPERINGEVVLVLTAHTDYTDEHPRPTIAIARAKEITDFFDAAYWEKWHANLADHALPELRRNENDHIEVGASPLLTDQGWLLVYSYIQHYYDESKRLFTIEAALLERDNPQRLISRTEAFLTPEENYEHYGLVPHIIFPTSVTLDERDELSIWYGGADTVCAKVMVRLSDLLRALDPQPRSRTFTRAKGNPILSPQGSGFESRDVMNAAAIDIDGTVHILYRAMSADNTSTVGLALSRDGVTIDERLIEPIYTPREDFEAKRGKSDGNSGCEDPRIVQIGKTLYLTYTAYDGVRSPSGAISTISIDDFAHRRFDKWSTPHLITPDNVDDKDVALLPEKIDGNYVVYHRVNGQICADLLPDLKSTTHVTRCIEIMRARRGMWDDAKVGIAGPPIKVPLPSGESAWLMIYHGVSASAEYSLGAALLDASGLIVLARTADPILRPVEEYEKRGEIANVVFSCGAVVRDDTVFLYYGGADKVIGVATASLKQIMNALT